MEKAELRLNLLKTRQSMLVEEWREKSDRISNHLLNSPLLSDSKTILAYFSFRQEPDLGRLFTSKHRWGFPRCVGNSLKFHLYTDKNSLKTGAYGISEPHADTPTINPDEVDLIIVPSVACDFQGYRLGYGGGYYDRLLSSQEWAIKPTIGIVFANAYLQQLPIQAWDKPLQNVCTETGLIRCRNSDS